MFLRGYGSQSYSQYNRNLFTDRGIEPYRKTNTNYKSGELGKIQGDAVRHWYFSTGQTLGLHTRRDDGTRTIRTGQFDNSHIYYNIYLSPEDSLYYGGFTHWNNDSEVELFLPFQSSPCLDNGLTLIAVDEACGYSNALDNPIDNEIRPVNVAVRYYIKAK